MITKTLLMSVAAFLSFGNIAFAGDLDLCSSEFFQGAYASAFRYCEKACSLNEGLGCGLLGAFYNDGLGVERDFRQAKTYFEKACSLNDGTGFAVLGVLYDTGFGVKQNKKVSKEYYGKACDLGIQEGCDKYRELNEQGY